MFGLSVTSQVVLLLMVSSTLEAITLPIPPIDPIENAHLVFSDNEGGILAVSS